VPQIVVKKLMNLGCEIREEKASRGHEGMLWRMKPLWEEPHRHVIFRDTDSRLNVREAAAVEKWIDSGWAAHMMHDHPHHAGRSMMGGVWGCISGLFPDKLWTLLVRKYVRHRKKGLDSQMLSKEIYPLLADSMLSHSSVKMGVKLQWPAKPFPLHTPWKGFVGQQITGAGRAVWAGLAPKILAGGETP